MDGKPMWQQASSFAARAHLHHTRKDGRTPYVAHVFRVAMTVRDLFECDDQIALCTAMLHDTIEDTPTDYDDILDAFGPEIADCVAALTKNMILREDLREPDYDLRLSKAAWQARLVKLADTYDNCCDALTLNKGPRRMKKMTDRCVRAIDLVRADDPEVVGRAAGRVQTLVDEVLAERA